MNIRNLALLSSTFLCAPAFAGCPSEASACYSDARHILAHLTRDGGVAVPNAYKMATQLAMQDNARFSNMHLLSREAFGGFGLGSRDCFIAGKKAVTFSDIESIIAGACDSSVSLTRKSRITQFFSIIATEEFMREVLLDDTVQAVLAYTERGANRAITTIDFRSDCVDSLNRISNFNKVLTVYLTYEQNDPSTRRFRNFLAKFELKYDINQDKIVDAKLVGPMRVDGQFVPNTETQLFPQEGMVYLQVRKEVEKEAEVSSGDQVVETNSDAYYPNHQTQKPWRKRGIVNSRR